MLKELFTVEEAAKKLCMSTQRLRRLQSQRIITFRQMGRKILFTESDLTEYTKRTRFGARTFLYFIGGDSTGFVKIGIADDPVVRVQTLQTGCPYELSLLATIQYPTREHAVEMERVLHKRFSAIHLRGEWFKPIENLDGLLEEISKPRPGSSGLTYLRSRLGKAA
jgi:excisionase family DNA binding protein